jgi:hypothetical protein
MAHSRSVLYHSSVAHFAHLPKIRALPSLEIVFFSSELNNLAPVVHHTQVGEADRMNTQLEQNSEIIRLVLAPIGEEDAGMHLVVGCSQTSAWANLLTL